MTIKIVRTMKITSTYCIVKNVFVSNRLKVSYPVIDWLKHSPSVRLANLLLQVLFQFRFSLFG